MLTESFIASSLSAPKITSANSALLKDAGIFIHSFQPQPALRSTLKKSVTAPNCLIFNDSHVFAAQSGKAVVNVYSREKGNQESTVPFPERIQSLALAADGTVLLLGTEGGAIIIWELCTGRQLSTPPAHLQQVTCLSVDPSSNFVVSGSADSNIHVWSLLDLLSFAGDDATAQDLRNPRHALSGHRGGITALTLGHSKSSVNIAISASKDKTAMVWNYQTGEHLRTFILGEAIPLCLTLDPADRAFYVGYNDGTVQVADFFTSKSLTPVSSIHDSNLTNTPVQLTEASCWSFPSQELGAALSTSLSYDGTTLLSGHESGKIVPWDVATGKPGAPLADYSGAAITNIAFLRPKGFLNEHKPTMKIHSVIKPRPHEAYSSTQGQLTGGYTFQAQFQDLETVESPSHSSFRAIMEQPGFPIDILDEGIAELATWHDVPVAPMSNGEDRDADFMALDGASEQEKELAQLREQVAHLKKLQKVSNAQIAALTSDVASMKDTEQATYERRMQKLKKRELKAEREWKALGVNGNKHEDEAMVVVGDEAEDGSSGTSESVEEEELSSDE